MPRGSPYHPSNLTPHNKGISSLLQKTIDLSLGPSTPTSEDSSQGPRWWEVADLTVIKASSNELTTVPPELAGFPSLSVLDLHSNLITPPLPASFGTLTDLTVLNLSNNQLTEWPIEIMALIHLRELDLSRNKLKELWPRDKIWKQSLKERMKSVSKEQKRQARQRDQTGSSLDADTSIDSIDSDSTTPDQSGGTDFCKLLRTNTLSQRLRVGLLQGLPSLLHRRSQSRKHIPGRWTRRTILLPFPS